MERSCQILSRFGEDDSLLFPCLVDVASSLTYYRLVMGAFWQGDIKLSKLMSATWFLMTKSSGQTAMFLQPLSLQIANVKKTHQPSTLLRPVGLPRPFPSMTHVLWVMGIAACAGLHKKRAGGQENSTSNHDEARDKIASFWAPHQLPLLSPAKGPLHLFLLTARVLWVMGRLSSI